MLLVYPAGMNGHSSARKRLFRAMQASDDGHPTCGASASKLGVREGKDVPVHGGIVHPGTGGMSVTPDDPARLPASFRPPSLGGVGKHQVFAIELSALPPEALGYRPDPDNPRDHGFVEPASAVSLDRLQQDLCGTRWRWKEVS